MSQFASLLSYYIQQRNAARNAAFRRYYEDGIRKIAARLIAGEY